MYHTNFDGLMTKVFGDKSGGNSHDTTGLVSLTKDRVVAPQKYPFRDDDVTDKEIDDLI